MLQHPFGFAQVLTSVARHLALIPKACEEACAACFPGLVGLQDDAAEQASALGNTDGKIVYVPPGIGRP